jgi:hypothetical protein
MCSRYHKWRGKESRKYAPGRPGHIEQPALTGRWVAPQGCTRVKSGFDFPILGVLSFQGDLSLSRHLAPSHDRDGFRQGAWLIDIAT